MFKPLTKALELLAFLVLGVALRHYWPSRPFWLAVSSPVEPSSHRAAPLVLADRPNVVVVLLDDAGAGDAGALGHPLLLTPNIDAFAARAVKFTQAYAGAPCCSPSRAVLLTGRASYRTGVYDFLSKHSGDMHMARTERTVASLLRDAGYATVHMGKWHLSHGPWGAPPSEFGFDHSNGSRLARVGKVAPPHVTVGMVPLPGGRLQPSRDARGLRLAAGGRHVSAMATLPTQAPAGVAAAAVLRGLAPHRIEPALFWLPCPMGATRAGAALVTALLPKLVLRPAPPARR